MKILSLRKKIIKSFSIAGLLAIILAALISFDIYQKKALEKTTSKINSEISLIKNQSSELKTKAIEIKKYITMWSSIDDQKKITSGIKMTEINSSLKLISKKYFISSPEIKVTLPEKIERGVFKGNTILTSFTTVTLTFRAINDVKALSFINEFIDSVPGYKVITKFEISKGDSYTTSDLIAITSNQASGKIIGKVDFFWYAFKPVDSKDNVLNNPKKGPDAK